MNFRLQGLETMLKQSIEVVKNDMGNVLGLLRASQHGVMGKMTEESHPRLANESSIPQRAN
jgi:translation elongation factor EF-G